MKQVASLRYGVIFKKAFCDVDVFKGFVRDILGINLEISEVETEKEFDTLIGNVKPRFDLYAMDEKNRVIVDIQHRRDYDHYDRFLHYHCVALLEQVKSWINYKPPLAVYTIVVLTSGDKHKSPVSVIDFDPKDLDGQPLGEIPHKVIYLCPKYLNDKTPEHYREWMQVIDDSLDGAIDESLYHLPEVEKILTSIEQDGVTPEERYWMIEEYSEEKAKQEKFEEGIARGIAQGIAQGIEEGLALGLEKGIEKGIEQGIEKGIEQGIEKGIEQGIEKGIEQGIEKGIEQGIEKGKLERDLEIAKSMLAKGMDIQTIMDITGLTAEMILQ